MNTNHFPAVALAVILASSAFSAVALSEDGKGSSVKNGHEQMADNVNHKDKGKDNNQDNSNSNRQSDPNSTRGEERAEERRGEKNHDSKEDRRWYDPLGLIARVRDNPWYDPLGLFN
jgi:hypothetical protein